MDHAFASAGLRFSYLCDPASIQELDPQTILDDLSDPETRYALRWWFATVNLTDFDHVVLAADCKTGRYVAMLAANDGATANEPYLNLQAAFVVDAMRGSMLMRRLLAFAILRIAGIGTMPRIIAAQTSTPSCYRMLSLFTRIIPNATIFPECNAPAVNLQGAALARRIARNIAPHHEYMAATATIKGARLTSATCFARTSTPEQKVDAMFEQSLGSGDQIMIVVDLRCSDEAAITTKTRNLVRARWKTPIHPAKTAPLPATIRITRRKPTLTA